VKLDYAGAGFFFFRWRAAMSSSLSAENSGSSNGSRTGKYTAAKCSIGKNKTGCRPG